ncbi:MAG TPA: IS5 family transposase [Rhodothermales bacterium]|nr:IS5 family transposase [Rhodothermales bacterium]
MKHYSTDLTDEQWALVEPLIPPARPGGHPRTTDVRRVLEAIFYLDKNACGWRDLPHDFPNHNTVYAYFALWRDDGTLERIYDVLHQQWRRQIGRAPQASAAALDSQSIQAAPEASERGNDAKKRVRGRKRHLIVDTEGLPLAVAVTPASFNDKAAAYGLIDFALQRNPSLKKVWADLAYVSGPLSEFALERGVDLEVTTVHEHTGFLVEARRWVVERTFAWLMRCRRLCYDFERLSRTVVALIYVAITRLLLNRLAPTS